MNTKVYIHEFINVVGHNRARYMQHMAANWSPLAQEERSQLCYGIWGVVGSTGSWPQVVNIWEEDGFDGLAESFRHELGHRDLQDPALAKWWATAAEMRSGGFDRILVPHPKMPTVEELVSGGGHQGVAYAHEIITTSPGGAQRLLDAAWEDAEKIGANHRWRLIGAWTTAMRNRDECVLLWAIPSWGAWAGAESDAARGRELLPTTEVFVRSRQRILLADAPLSPTRTGRQPTRTDRVDWTD
ncbi:hypothetical protein ACIQNU_42060 [Streptomyces sp. NPDC091292]|uniref:hypothetical protein n=1 Tax=Streptomyces sp. NPDC091292 TaxID=3365991 RepID=UPI0038172B7E